MGSQMGSHLQSQNGSNKNKNNYYLHTSKSFTYGTRTRRALTGMKKRGVANNGEP